MKTQDVEYRDGDRQLRGMLAWDGRETERRPGILVVHAGPGLDEHAKERTRRLAALGYVAFACDMYGNGGVLPADEKRKIVRELADDLPKLRARANTALATFADRPEVDPTRLAAIGFCFGGLTVLEMARVGEDLKGVVSFHGSLKTSQPAAPHQIKAKILACHGALDPHVPTAQVTAFVDEMNAAKADWQLIVYGGALHGFAHEGSENLGIPGVGYHADADRRSWNAMQSFFSELFEAGVTAV